MVEGPWLVWWPPHFHLFYSTGEGYTDPGYSIWSARAAHLLGPYTKASQVVPRPLPQPVVSVDWSRHSQGTNSTFEGPGHASVVRDGAGAQWLLYHAWPYHRHEVPLCQPTPAQRPSRPCQDVSSS